MKRALVTGGSGAIGAAICSRLARSGHFVYVHANQHVARAEAVVRWVDMSWFLPVARGFIAAHEKDTTTVCRNAQQENAPGRTFIRLTFAQAQSINRVVSAAKSPFK